MIDIVMPAHEKDFEVLPLAVAGALRYITPLRRVCVVSEKPFAYDDDRVEWHPEPSASTLPSSAQLRARWAEHNPGLARRATWLYQHLLKLAAGEYIDDLSRSYLVSDSDVVFLRPVRFDPRELRFPYSFDAESHGAYRDAYRRLLGVTPPTQRGLIAHHMLFDGALLDELKAEIEERHGRSWYEAYCGVVDYDELSPISVFNTYGWWVLERHPELAGHRQLTWRDVPMVPTPAQCAQFAQEVDFIAAHEWLRRPPIEQAGSLKTLRRPDPEGSRPPKLGEPSNPSSRLRLERHQRCEAPRSEWPIIVGGCHRSGTTLVRRILNSHSGIHCGPEVKFFLDFYGPPRGVKDYMNTARGLASEDELLDFFGDGFVELHRRVAQSAGKPRWADKAPENVLYLSHWERLLGDQWLFIHVVRNPLDTIASLREAGFGDGIPRDILGQVVHYLNHVAAGIEFGMEHPQRYHQVIYEELVTTPDETLASLMSFLGAEFEPQQLEFNSQHPGPALEDYKINSTTAVHADSLHGWPERLAEQDAAFIWAHTRLLWMQVDPRNEFVKPPAALQLGHT